MEEIKTKSWAQPWFSWEAWQGEHCSPMCAIPGSVTSGKLYSLPSCFSWVKLHKPAAGLALLSGHSPQSSVLEGNWEKSAGAVLTLLREGFAFVFSDISVSCMSLIGTCECTKPQVFLNINPYFINSEGLKGTVPSLSAHTGAADYNICSTSHGSRAVHLPSLGKGSARPQDTSLHRLQ